MKKLLIAGATTVFLGLTVASMSAQTQSTASSSTSYIETSKFIGRKVKSAQGDEIGTVKDIVLDRNTGCLAYTVVSTGGGGGTRVSGGGKMVAVPWAVYSPSTDINVLTVTVDRDRIYNAPVFDYARIEEYSRPEYMTNVYSYYGVSSGTAGVGVSGGTSTTTTGTTTTGATTTTGTATGANTTTSAAASPLRRRDNRRIPTPQQREEHTGVRRRPRAQRWSGGATQPTPSPYGRAATSPSKERTPSKKEKQEQTTPSGRGKTETQSETERAPSEGATTGEKTKESTRRGARSREAGTPPERPQE